MKLTRIFLYRYSKPFLFKFSSAHMERKTAESIIVHSIYDNGIEGFGECAPRFYVTGEDIESVVDLFENCFIPVLFESSIDGFDDIHSVLALSEKNGRRHTQRNISAAMCALEIALLDAFAKFRNTSLSSFFEPIAQVHIPNSISIPIMTNTEIESIYSRLGRPNLEHVKVLVGKEIDEAKNRLAFIRKLIGSQVNIRLEVNEGWRFQEAVSCLGILEKYNIFAVEQPLPRKCFNQLKKLRSLIPIPIILDESICSLDDAQRHIEENVCDIINIKISKCGGILNSQKIADYANSKGIPLQLGVHVGESAILSAAGKILTGITPGFILSEAASELLFNYDPGSQKELKTGKEKYKEKKGIGIPLELAHQILSDAYMILSY